MRRCALYTPTQDRLIEGITMAQSTTTVETDGEAPATLLTELKSFLASINPKTSRDAANALAAAFPNAAMALRISACEPYAKGH